MSQSLIEQIEKLIKEQAWELCEYDHVRDNESFVKGAQFILPFLKKCIEQRNRFAETGRWTPIVITLSDQELLKLLEVE